MKYAIPIIGACSSAVPAPFSHPYYLGTAYLHPTEDTHGFLVREADVIVVLDCDTPWIPSRGPSSDTRVFVLDSGDPLRRGIGFWHIEAESIHNCDGALALQQVLDKAKKSPNSNSDIIVGRQKRVTDLRQRWLGRLEAAEGHVSVATPDNPAYYTLPQIVAAFRKEVVSRFGSEGNFVVLNEAITGYSGVWEHLRPERAGQHLTSGGSSLGWSLGAAVGVSLAGGLQGNMHDLVAVIVGDGSFVFSVPSAAYWMARKYDTVCSFDQASRHRC